MTIKRLGPNKWQVRVSIGNYEDRKQLKRTVAGSRDDAKRVEAQLYLQAGVSSPIEDNITFRDFALNKWLPVIDVSECTREGYENHIKTMSKAFGHLRLSQLSPKVLEAYFLSHHSRGMAHKEYTTLRACLNTALRWRYIESSPLVNMTPPKKPRRKPQAIYSAEQVRFLREKVRGEWWEPLWLLGIFCGLRPEEATAFDVPPRDWDGVLHIERVYSHQGKLGWVLSDTKTEESASTVYVPVEIAQRILEITEGRTGAIARTKHVPMNWRPNRSTYQQAYERWCKKNGYPYIPPKNFRHTAASLMIASKEVDIQVVSKVLRHSMVSTTVNSYLETVDGAKKDAAESLFKVVTS